MRYGLSRTQKGIYSAYVGDRTSLVYNLPLFEELPENIDTDRLKEAMESVISLHPGLSSRISVDDKGEVFQEDGPAVRVEIRDMGEGFDPMVLVRPFDLDKGVSRFSIIRSGKKKFLFIDIHHIAFDHYSLRILSKQFGDAYDGKLAEKESFTPADISAAEKDDFDEEFYDPLLSGTDSSSIPVRDVYSDKPSCGTVITRFAVDSDALRSISKKNGFRRTAFFASAMAYAISRTAATDTVFMGLVHNGRNDANRETVSMIARTLPFVSRFADDSAIADVLRNSQKQIDGCTVRDGAYQDLIGRYGLQNEILFAYQGLYDLSLVAGHDTDPHFLAIDPVPTEKFRFEVMDDGDGYLLKTVYRSDYYSEGLVRAIVKVFITTLNEMLSKERFRDIVLLDAESAEKIRGFNATDVDQDLSITLMMMIKRNMTELKDRTAVVFRDKTFTYGELDELSGRIAAFITSKGIGRDEFVPILVKRNENIAIASVGVVRSGAAYQPLDSSYPKERLNFMVKDSGAKLVIADRELMGLLDEYKGEFAAIEDVLAYDGIPKDIEYRPEDAFTILYTSGTTGLPKGCILENRNLTSFINYNIRLQKIDRDSRLATYASFGFDANMDDTFSTLCAGGTLYIVPEDMRLDISAMDRYFIECGITHSLMTTQVGRQFAAMTECRTLGHFMVGGEKLVPVNPPEWMNLINGYGPTETTVYVLSDTVVNDNPLCPIGRPNDNVRAYVVDTDGRQLPIGVPGELCVSGPQVSRGYLNRPDKTGAVFITNPFTDEPLHSRAYRTGDIVRWLPDGRVEYIGRNDGQVKVRGFRIELTEVEGVIRKYPGIEDATVAAFDSPSGGKFIAAYIVSKERIDIPSLEKFIGSLKPPYMIPAVTMQIEKIPLNVNSKVDRRKLPKPEFVSEDDAKPENGDQQRIFDIASEVLGTKSFGIDTDLHRVGLTSITTIRLSVMLSKGFDVDIAISDMKGDCTVRSLERLIKSNTREEFEKLDEYPLSKIQEGLFVECIADPGSTAYNIPLLLRIDDSVDVEKLRKSIVSAVNAHPHIKARIFTDREGNVVQRRMDDDPFSADDIGVIEADDVSEVTSTLIEPFQLIGGRLFRFSVIITKNGKYLFSDIHHMYTDGTSMNILMGSITDAYLGREPVPETFTGFDAVLNEQRRRTPEALGENKAYYDSLLSGCEPDILPRTDLYEKGEGLGTYRMEGMSVEGVEKYCKDAGITMNSFICSAFGLMLSKFCGTREPIFTTVYSGRNDSRLMNTVAMLVRTMPMLCKVQGRTSDYIRSVSQMLMDDMNNDVMSFAEICKEYGVRPDILFVYQGDMFAFDSFCGKPSQLVELPVSSVKTPITYSLWIEKGRLQHVCDYDRSIYSEAFASSLAHAFDKAIEQMLIHDELNDMDLSDGETLSKIESFNRTEVPQDLTVSPISKVEGFMKDSPGSVAVVFRDRTVTYGELDSLSKRIASYVQGKGIGREDYVSVLVRRSEFIAVATIGVLRTGAAYQPLDPSYPKERLNFMVTDSGAKLVIADRDIVGLIDEYKGDILFTDEIEGLKEGKVKDVVHSPHDAFTILYTSGTTGTPKGCILENMNVMSTVNHYTNRLEASPKMRTASYASYGFDANMMDIFVTLCNGGALYVIPEDMRLDLPQVDRYFSDNGITHGFMTTQVGRQFVSMTRCRTLKHFLVGGEKLVPVIPTDWVDFVNIYGPTETSVYVLSSHVKDDNPLCPIGRPNDNTKVYVVDGTGHQVPIGALGELYIAGPQVSRGYLNRPDKTSEVFVRNPFSDDPDYMNAYRTGDVVRWLPDGNVEYIGRRDGQVKIRGFRVELTEVEKVIREYDGIRDATVAAFDSPSGGKFMAAYVVSDSKVDISSLNDFIAERKPPYMVPAVTMQIDRIPLNVNSKVDRRKLPVPTPSARTAGRMPSNELEKKLCDLFASVLGIDTVYADDNFFNIGGTSITASKLLVGCMNNGLSLVYKNIFDNPTPMALAAFLKGYSVKREAKEQKTVDNGVLSFNRTENLGSISSGRIGNVLLAGATGFLGIHVLKEVIDRDEGEIICLIRGNGKQSARDRLKTMLMYYFGGNVDEALIDRIRVVEADITAPDLKEILKDVRFDTIINCAAVVKHFAFDDSIEKVNHYGVKNLIEVALDHDAVLMHTSTLSVAGESVNGSIPDDVLLKEDMLDFGQDLENKYVHSKFMGEKEIIEAIEKDGLKGKIFRAGNLMSRESDGEFQINFATNSFMRSIRSYVTLGCYPVDDLDAVAEFSPIDMTAKALVLLAGTPERFTVFNGNNPHCVHMYNIIDVLRKNGFEIEIVDKDEFNRRFTEKLRDESVAGEISGLISYMTNDGESRRMIGSDNRYTVKALYRLGFSWPIIDLDYIGRAVRSLETFRFFRK